MESSTSQQHTKDIDANCRLRHGLNIKCLAQIFQYLDSIDLYTVSGMNNFYKKIINDLVIPNHVVDFYELFKQGICGSLVFERFAQYSSPDQLRSVSILMKNNISSTHGTVKVVLPNHFRKVEKIQIYGQM